MPASGKQFGFSSHSFKQNVAFADDEAAAAEAAGATLHRFNIQWRSMQVQASYPPLSHDSQYPLGQVPNTQSTLHEIDAFYLELTARGITPVIIPFDAPVWASKYAGCASNPLDVNCQNQINGGYHLVPAAAYLPQYRAFVRAVAERYPAAIIEPWNEPNLHYGQQDYVATPSQMKDIQCAAYAELKALDPPRTVTSVGFAGTNFYPYADGMVDLGAQSCWDTFSAHFYTGRNINYGDALTSSDGPLARYIYNIRDVRNGRDSDPLWISETGYSTSGNTDGGYTETQQANLTCRLYSKLITMPDVDGVLFHTLRDNNNGNIPTNQTEYGYGFVREGFVPKLAHNDFVARANANPPTECPAATF